MSAPREEPAVQTIKSVLTALCIHGLGFVAAVVVTVVILGLLPFVGVLDFLGIVFLTVLAALATQAVAWLSSRKSSPRRRIAFAGGFALFCIVAMVVYVSWSYSPKQLFRRVVLDPIPESVEVLQGEEQPAGLVDTTIWLHFKTSPEDFEAVLKSHAYTKVPEGLPTDIDAGRGPEWFRPEEHGARNVYLFEDKDAPIIHTIWVNDAHTDVYYCFCAW
jgi:hypothetical protein